MSGPIRRRTARRPTTGSPCSAAPPGRGSRGGANTICTISSPSSRRSTSTIPSPGRLARGRGVLAGSGASTAFASMPWISCCTTATLRPTRPPRHRRSIPRQAVRHAAALPRHAATRVARPAATHTRPDGSHPGSVTVGEVSSQPARSTGSSPTPRATSASTSPTRCARCAAASTGPRRGPGARPRGRGQAGGSAGPSVTTT